MYTQAESFITAEEFGTTGPPGDPTKFTTFLITIDLSSFAIQLQGGQQYVVGVTNNFDNFVTGGGFFRQIGSRSTGFEDLFQQNNTPAIQLPGFLDSQLNAGREQHAGSVSLGNGSGIIDAGDLTVWENTYGQTFAPLSAISAAVPEPTTCTLALAALCLAMSRRRAR